MKVSDYIISFLKNNGCNDIFMITGGGIMHLVESVGSTKGIKYYCNHHEQASAIAAEAYGRLKGMGVCLVTTGPGGTNTVTGVLGAWLDSIPVIYLAGQTSIDTLANNGLRQLGIQESPNSEILKPITKYSATVLDSKEIRYQLEKAIFLAKEGRPGPVWLEIPLCVQAAQIEPDSLKGFVPPAKEALDLQVEKFIELLKSAKRPVIIAGHAIRLSSSYNKFKKVVENLKIPVVTSMNGTDAIETPSPYFVGRHGIFGNRAGNFAVQGSDLIISFGARNYLWNIGYNYNDFARNAKKIVVDIDQAELNKKTIKADLKIHADLGVFLDAIEEIKNIQDYSNWLKKCQGFKNKYTIIKDNPVRNKNYVNYYHFIEAFNKESRLGDIIVTGNGTAFTATIQGLEIKKNQRHICNVGCASMGYDLPAAIGACIANNKKEVVLFTGDGSIMMNIQELQTIKNYNLPIKIFLINNQGYLAIRNTQDNYFDSHYVGSSSSSGVTMPNFKALAGAFGIKYECIKNQRAMKGKIKKVLSTKGPVLCELLVDPKQQLLPRLKSEKNKEGKLIAKPLEDMYPFLPESEINSNIS